MKTKRTQFAVSPDQRKKRSKERKVCMDQRRCSRRFPAEHAVFAFITQPLLISPPCQGRKNPTPSPLPKALFGEGLGRGSPPDKGDLGGCIYSLNLYIIYQCQNKYQFWVCFKNYSIILTLAL